MSDLVLDKAKISGHLRKLVYALQDGMERLDDKANNHDLLDMIAASLNEEIKRSSIDLGQLLSAIQAKAKDAEAAAKAELVKGITEAKGLTAENVAAYVEALVAKD